MINDYRLLDRLVYDWRARFKLARETLNLQELRLLLLELDVCRTLVQTEVYVRAQQTPEVADPPPTTPTGLFVAAVRARLPSFVVDALVDTYFKDTPV